MTQRENVGLLCLLAVVVLFPLGPSAAADEPAPTPTPQATRTPSPRSTAAPAPAPARPPQAPKRPSAKVITIGDTDAPPTSPTRPPLASLAGVPAGSGAPLAISDDNLAFVAEPIVPASPEEYGVLMLGLAAERKPLEENAVALLHKLQGKPEVGEDDAWVQGLCNLSGRLSSTSARLAAIVAPDEFRVVHADVVTVCRTFDRAFAVLCKEPTSQPARSAADDTLADAAAQAGAAFEAIGHLLRSMAAATRP